MVEESYVLLRFSKTFSGRSEEGRIYCRVEHMAKRTKIQPIS